MDVYGSDISGWLLCLGLFFVPISPQFFDIPTSDCLNCR